MSRKTIVGPDAAVVELVSVLGRVLTFVEIGWRWPEDSGKALEDDGGPVEPVIWYVRGNVRPRYRQDYGRNVEFTTDGPRADHIPAVVEALAQAVRHFGGKVEVQTR